MDTLHREIASRVYDEIVSACAAAGFEPRVVQTYDQTIDRHLLGRKRSRHYPWFLRPQRCCTSQASCFVKSILLASKFHYR